MATRPWHDILESDNPTDRMVRFINELPPHNLWQGVEALDERIQEHERQARIVVAQQIIGLIDDLHIGRPDSDTTDRLFKRIKNTIRDRFEAQYGEDPAPRYPVEHRFDNQSAEADDESDHQT